MGDICKDATFSRSLVNTKSASVVSTVIINIIVLGIQLWWQVRPQFSPFRAISGPSRCERIAAVQVIVLILHFLVLGLQCLISENMVHEYCQYSRAC